MGKSSLSHDIFSVVLGVFQEEVVSNIVKSQSTLLSMFCVVISRFPICCWKVVLISFCFLKVISICENRLDSVVLWVEGGCVGLAFTGMVPSLGFDVNVEEVERVWCCFS